MKKINWNIIKIIISLLFLITSFFIRENFIVELIVLLVSYILVSYEIYIKAFKNILHLEIFDENLLMIIATIGAFIIGEHHEAVLVMLLYEIGEYLSDKANDHSIDEISKILDTRIDTINLKVDDGYKTMDIKEAKTGDIFLVKPNEVIPLDGIVIEGESFLDTSSLTGESSPQLVKTNDSVISGSINNISPLIIKATSEYENSTNAKILEFINNSENNKSNKEKFITKFAKIYTPIVVLISFLVMIIPTLIFKQDAIEWLYKGLELLVISCPCALVISIPLSYFCAMGRGSKEGVIFKGGKEIDELNKVNIVAIDKTGTLTENYLHVEKINNYSSLTNREIVRIAAHLEYYSNHPLARAILNEYNETFDLKTIKDFKEILGQGVSARIKNEKIYLGSYNYLSNICKDLDNSTPNLLYLVKDNKCIASFKIGVKIKESSYALKKQLANLGIKSIVILSGDKLSNTKKIADKLSIDTYYGDLLPLEKVAKLEELKKQGIVAFLGDGINDAPSISKANVGIALGGMGNDITINASDIVIMNDDLNTFVNAIKLSKMVHEIILFNIIFAISFKFLMMVLALALKTPMWLAVISDVGVTLLLILHSITILSRKIKTH